MRILFAVLLVAVTTGCGFLYRPEVQQGVPLTAEQLAGLRPGLSKRQVQLLLGSPPVADVFHPDRWDYVYTMGEAGQVPAPEKRLTLYFRDGALVRAEGELAPATLTRPGNEVGAGLQGHRAAEAYQERQRREPADDDGTGAANHHRDDAGRERERAGRPIPDDRQAGAGGHGRLGGRGRCKLAAVRHQRASGSRRN